MNNNYFICKNCGKKVNLNAIGTKHRNHCPYCLWSLHVDGKIYGDRKPICHGLMEPIGLAFKDEGIDKYGKKRQGEIMINHKCQICGKESKNRIAGDDNPEEILRICSENDKVEIKEQLLGEKRI